jgi:hypothetical protein
MHENYKNKWRNDRFKSKPKTWNKKTKTKTQVLQQKTWSVQDQNTNNFYCDEIKKCKHKKIE